MEADLTRVNRRSTDAFALRFTNRREESIIEEIHNEEERSMDREFTPEDLSKNRTMAALGYIVFFIPLMMCKDSKVGRYCANQGLILTVLMVLVSVLFKIFSIVPFIGWLFSLAGSLACFALFCVGLLCFVQMMTHDNVVELPYVGGFKLLP
jgi:uncharacterized membrane protein